METPQLQQGDKTIVLGRSGRERTFVIPELPIETLEKVVHLIMEMGERTDKDGNAKGEDWYFKNTNYVVKCGIQAGDPSFTDADFGQLRPTLKQLQEAFAVVSTQAGMEKATEDAAAGGTPLEQESVPTAPTTSA